MGIQRFFCHVLNQKCRDQMNHPYNCTQMYFFYIWWGVGVVGRCWEWQRYVYRCITNLSHEFARCPPDTKLIQLKWPLAFSGKGDVSKLPFQKRTCLAKPDIWKDFITIFQSQQFQWSFLTTTAIYTKHYQTTNPNHQPNPPEKKNISHDTPLEN